MWVIAHDTSGIQPLCRNYYQPDAICAWAEAGRVYSDGSVTRTAHHSVQLVLCSRSARFKEYHDLAGGGDHHHSDHHHHYNYNSHARYILDPPAFMQGKIWEQLIQRWIWMRRTILLRVTAS